MTGRLTGRGVLIWLFGFFGVIFATNAYFIMVSHPNIPRARTSRNPICRALNTTRRWHLRAEQAALGWKATITAIRLANGNVRVEVRIRDRNGNAVAEVGLAGALRHPADENRDRVFHLTKAAPGMYQAELSDVSPGGWDVLVHSAGEQTPFEASRRLWVR